MITQNRINTIFCLDRPQKGAYSIELFVLFCISIVKDVSDDDNHSRKKAVDLTDQFSDVSCYDKYPDVQITE